MLKRKLSTVILVATISNLVATPSAVFAQNLKVQSIIEGIEEGTVKHSNENIEVTEASISKFDLISNSNFHKYEEAFKIDSSKIKITASKPDFNGTELSYMNDGDMNTYWAPSTRDSETSKTEVEYVFDEVVEIDRIIYAARQNQAADNCGFPSKFEIYGSTTDDGEYELVATGGGYNSTKDTVEFKFNATEFKKLKFKFVEVAGKSTWPHIAEIGFFKEDSLIEKMDELFADESKTTLNEKYSSTDALNELEELAKAHPFYDEYKEAIADARIILRDEQLTPSVADVKLFSYTDNEEYNNAFRMDKSNIKSITKNAGHYSSRVIENAIDGDLSTYWETNKANSATWNNEVELEFIDRTVIEKIVYGARPQDGKGFPEEFEIYVSNTSEGDTYELLTTGKHTKVNNLIEINFQPTEVKRVKFKFTKSNQNWATINELWFYKEDTVVKEVKCVFEDNLHTVLSPNYDTVQEIEALEERVNNHPLKDELIEIVEKAKALINGNTVEKSEIFTLSQRGDENAQKNERRQVYAGGNLDVTGYYLMPGESVEVYVDADGSGVLPMIAFSQVGEIDGNSKATSRYKLNVGKNIVTAPEGTKGYAIYFVNRALPEDQAYAPKVRLEGESLNKYPVYIHGKTDPREYINEVVNHTGANMTDISGDRFLISGQNSEAKIAYGDGSSSPLDLVREMEELISIFDTIAGYDINDENPIHRPSNGLYHLKMTNGSGLFASNEYTHLGASAARSIFSGSVYGWGNLHEFAHQIENRDMRLLEVTNNIYSMMAQLISGKSIRNLTGTQSNLDRYFTFEGTKGFGGFGDSYDLTFGLFERLLVLLQITNYFGLDAYSDANRLVRENPSRYATGSYQQIITAMSESTGYDLAPHFEYYNYPVTDATKEFTSQFKEVEKKIHYTTIPSRQMEIDNEEQFNDETKAIISKIKTEEDGFTLTIGTNDDNKGTIAYEIYRDGEFVGFTRSNTYKDVVDISKSYNYEVIAYDYRVNESIKSNAVSSDIGYTPLITVESNVLIKLNEEFNPLNYVKANAYNNEILENIEVIENTVDNTKNGLYKVVYKVEDRNQSATKEMSVEVVSNYDYASDVQWESATSGWKTVNKDKAVGSENKIKLNVNGEVKEFNKGIGVATNSEIVYNLEEKNYDYFTAYVGTDKNYGDNRTSIDFIILADGVEVYRSATIKRDSLAEFVKIDLAGVKELKLIADNHDGNGLGDFASWGDAKFYTNDCKPALEIDESKTIKVGETIEDVIGNIIATDVEDGDITSKVVVSGYENVDFNKTGNYKITYSVSDSDGNTVSKERTISVVDMKDFTYLTDYEWTSAVQSYSTTKKDTSVNGNAIRLTGENGEEITYERGIGAHANGTIIYDLTDKDYNYFTTYIGVDRNMYNRPGSISFEVYVDGVLKYDSGLMLAKDPQKYVEVEISGAKELKLLVKDGGNGNGSDHGSFGDTKLHYANEERADLTKLKEAIEKAESINFEGYTEESVSKLSTTVAAAKELLEADFVSVESSNEAIKNIEAAMNNLEKAVDLNEIVKFEDSQLKKDIKNALNLQGDDITIGDMYNLISLECSGYVSSLKGLEYAKNLESLNIDYNEVFDLSPLQNLKKLTNFSGLENFILKNQDKVEDDKYIIEDFVIDINGERILPSEIVLDPRTNPVKVNIGDVLNGNKIILDKGLTNGAKAVEILYESKVNNYQGYIMYLLKN